MKEAFVAHAIVVLIAVPSTILNSSLMAAVSERSDSQHIGTNLEIINAFTVISQLADTIYTGFVSRAYGDSFVMLFGAGCALVTVVVASIYRW